jgi:hypothetical protein
MSAPTAAVAEAPVYVCYNCGGSGECPKFRHIADGVCFTCQGTGRLNFKPRPAVAPKRDPNSFQKTLNAAQRKIVLAAYGCADLRPCGTIRCEAVVGAKVTAAGVDYTLIIDVADITPAGRLDHDPGIHPIGGGAIHFRGKRGAWTDIVITDGLRRRISPRQAVALLDAIAR